MTAKECLSCATTHTENGQVLPGTKHCKDPQYEHLMACSCLDYTAKEEGRLIEALNEFVLERMP